MRAITMCSHTVTHTHPPAPPALPCTQPFSVLVTMKPKLWIRCAVFVSRCQPVHNGIEFNFALQGAGGDAGLASLHLPHTPYAVTECPTLQAHNPKHTYLTGAVTARVRGYKIILKFELAPSTLQPHRHFATAHLPLPQTPFLHPSRSFPAPSSRFRCCTRHATGYSAEAEAVPSRSSAVGRRCRRRRAAGRCARSI